MEPMPVGMRGSQNWYELRGGGGKDPRKPTGSDPFASHAADVAARRAAKKSRKLAMRERSKFATHELSLGRSRLEMQHL